jgi:hypothetical protein
MENIQQAFALGRQQAIGRLWGMSAGAKGLQLGDAERHQVADQLRSLATLIERAPELITGLVVMAGESVSGDQEGVHSTCIITGVAPAIAAAYITLEEHGASAVQEVLPQLIMESLTSSLEATEVQHA